MKIGLALHTERGVDSVFEEARAADRQGFDSVWLFDHLANPFGAETPDGPYESFTLMTGIGAVTSNVRLAWSMLNLSFRRPVVLAKMLATLDHITGGRVICSVGSGWFLDEYEAYDVPLIDDHDERAEYAREVIRVLKHLWTHPAPEITDFDGRYVHIKGLGFNPAPYQKPHPPIWVGGDSDATLETVKELADGWVTLAGGNEKRLAEVTSATDWPKREIEIIKTVRIYVAQTREAALAEVAEVVAKGGPFTPTSVEEFVEKEVVGTPGECVAKLKELESWGVTTVRTTCDDAAHQERVASMVLPNFAP